MNIGQAAAASGVSAKMIRHYESIGVIPRPPRSAAGYRRYDATDVMRLNFLQRARAAGFAAPEIKKLISLWQDRRRPAREVKRLVEAHLREIETRIAELTGIASALSHLVAHCRGDERPECPILESFTIAAPVKKSATAAHRFSHRSNPARRRAAARRDTGRN